MRSAVKGAGKWTSNWSEMQAKGRVACLCAAGGASGEGERNGCGMGKWDLCRNSLGGSKRECDARAQVEAG